MNRLPGHERANRHDLRARGRVIAPWGRRNGDLRFETEGAWKRAGTTVDSLAKELRLALQYPEGAAGFLPPPAGHPEIPQKPEKRKKNPFLLFCFSCFLCVSRLFGAPPPFRRSP